LDVLSVRVSVAGVVALPSASVTPLGTVTIPVASDVLIVPVFVMAVTALILPAAR
jgi:hypothetical protein